MVLVDGEQETEAELNLPGKYKETNNTSNPCLGVFSFFSGLISFLFRFLLTVNKYHHSFLRSVLTYHQLCAKFYSDAKANDENGSEHFRYHKVDVDVDANVTREQGFIA